MNLLKRIIDFSFGSRFLRYNPKISVFLDYLIKMDYVDLDDINSLSIFGDPGRREFKILYSQIKKESGILLTPAEAYQIFIMVRNLEKLQGDIAEVGVYRGGSAKIICRAKKNKTFFLFDTFKGIPEISDIDDFAIGQYTADYDRVRDYFLNETNVVITKGKFPNSAGFINDRRFCFVHLDVDTYASTLAGLSFFYPRLLKGGVLISHDYLDHEGVRAAFEAYFKKNPIPVFETSGRQCMVVKTD